MRERELVNGKKDGANEVQQSYQWREKRISRYNETEPSPLTPSPTGSKWIPNDNLHPNDFALEYVREGPRHALCQSSTITRAVL